MNNNDTALQGKVALITGSARRLGAMTAETLHAAGMKVIIHYRNASQDAIKLQAKLEQDRPDSVFLLKADLLETEKFGELLDGILQKAGQLDVLVNNASSFYPTQIGNITEQDWDDLMGSNVKAPLFLSQVAAPYLQATEGVIINMVDIHADRPLKNHTVYVMAKAALVMLTKSLARELGPKVRVNAVAPGAILWPEHGMDDATQAHIVEATALKRSGEPADIANAILYLVRDAKYTTGQILTVDGGRTLAN